MSLSVCGLEDIQLNAFRSNELVVKLSVARTKAPGTTATIQASLYDGATLVPSSEINLSNEGTGAYSGIFPLLPLTSGRSYDLRLVVTVSAVVVIDEKWPVLTE